MTRLLVAVVMVISVFTTDVTSNPTCTGCLVGGTCHPDGYRKTEKLAAGGTKTCKCTSEGWSCFALFAPIYITQAPPACIGCPLNNKCLKTGESDTSTNQFGTTTCTCVGLMSISCYQVTTPKS